MKNITRLSLLLALTLCSVTGVRGEKTVSTATKDSNTMQISFNGSTYLHRWSKDGQNEFTQKNEPDLEKWHEMVTINVYPSVKTGEQLAATASQVVANYQEHGKIIKTDSKPRTPTHPAEHLAVAVLGTPEFLESVFARFCLVDNTGVAVIYSHRTYGAKVGPQVSTWLHDSGPGIEKTLMTWTQVPKVAELEKLPQSRQ